MRKFHILLLTTTLFFLQAYLIRFKIGPYPSNLQEVLIFSCSLSFLVLQIKEKRLGTTIKNLKKHWIILSFLALTILSIFSTGLHQNLDFYRHLKFLVFASSLSFITLESFPQKEKAIKTMGLGAIFFGIFSLIYNLSGFNVAHDLRLQGPLDAAVYLAYYLTPFFIYFSIQYIKNKKRPALLLALTAGLLILATKSMGAIGASFIIIAFYIIRNSQILKSRRNKSILAILTLLITSVIFYSKILPTLQTEYSSLDERGEIWLVATELLKEPRTTITGLGFGQFQPEYEKNAKEILGKNPLDFIVLQPHNIFLLFLSNFGIVGLAFLIFLLIRARKLNWQSSFPYIAAYFFIHGLIDTPFFKNDILILLLIFLELSYCDKPVTKASKTA